METLKTYLIPILAGLAAPALPPILAAETAPPDWQLVWSDEFNAEGLPNRQWWDYEEGYLRNNELQYYTQARLENCRQENGQLIIEARNDDFEGRPITSASLTSKRSASWTYGRFEVRAQVAGGRGTWPAIWMLGDNIGEVGWPHCGEIDIMEFVGYDPDTIHGTVHTTAYNHIQNTARGGTVDYDDLSETMHVYAVEWEPDEIRFYVDEHLYYTFENDGTGNDATWPFHKPQYLKLNLAIGGDWGGAQGVDNALYPAQFLIDYVRVYQRPEQPPYTVSLKAIGPGKLRIIPEKDTYQAGETITLIADPDIGMQLGKWKNVQLSRALQTTYQVNRSLLVEADFADPSCLLQNADFSAGLENWYTFVDSSATSTFSTDEQGHTRIAITRAGSADWHVQLGQAGFDLKTGKTYELSFEIKTISGTPSLTAAFAQSAAPYATYHASKVTLSPNTQTVTLRFTHTQANEPNARIEFRLGTQAGTVEISKVRLVNLDEPALSSYQEWKRSHAIRPIADAEDPDHDLRPNILEYLWQSDPSLADPYKPIATVSNESGRITLDANIEPSSLPDEISIDAQQSNDLKNWQDAASPPLKFQRLKIHAVPPIAD